MIFPIIGLKWDVNFKDTAHRPWRNKRVAFALEKQRSLKIPEMYKVANESEKYARVHQLIIFCLRILLFSVCACH